jgi:hypothetical protein
MVIFKYILALIWTTGAFAQVTFDKKDIINGVEVQTGKSDSTRTYQGTIQKTLNYPITVVIKGITNFHEKCNNDYKEKRELTDKSFDCRYHNDNLIETLVIRDINKDGWNKEQDEIDRFILGRRVYNRGEFSYYELVQIFQTKNSSGQKVLIVKQTMLNEAQAKVYVKPKLEKESAFDHSSSTFVLTETKTNETHFEYTYQAETSHWILNKEISVPQVFSSISKSILDLLSTVTAESALKNRDVASN